MVIKGGDHNLVRQARKHQQSHRVESGRAELRPGSLSVIESVVVVGKISHSSDVLAKSPFSDT